MRHLLYDIFEQIYSLEKSGSKIIKLNVGEPDWKPPRAAIEAAAFSMYSGEGKYGSSSGEIELRELLSQAHECKTENITITPGSKFAIYSLLRMHLKRGDNAIISSPYWTAYSLICKHIGAKIKLIETADNGWKPDISKFEDAIDSRTRLIILNSPSNPTSIALEEDKESELLFLAQRKGILLFADDAYRDLCFDGRKERPLAPNLIIVNSFSKTFGMTGWRIGYAVMPKETASKLSQLNRITITNVPLFLQKGVLSALKHKKRFVRKVRNVCMRRLTFASKFLSNTLRFQKPNAGFYIFPALPNGMDASLFADKLLQNGVAVVPGMSFGNYKSHIRISLCYNERILAQAFKKINSLLT
ncbi:MAG: pyridoxal phosphate-dependent aminotransferase [Candidatus Anstonellales archaeon]